MEKQTIGSKIAALRKEKNLTQAQLAEMIGVTDKAVSKWERNLSCPDIELLPRLSEIFGVTVDELLQATQNPTVKPNNLSPLSFVLHAVSTALGIAVAVLSLLNQIDSTSAFGMLGIGLGCMGLEHIMSKK
ncbi:MAG: helix-turn-helix transcriptional regulator [Oscillospiraceae bacterium]|nr:helix-turn-helix transcriptional regulator [Oscillospiraceae bacterium]